MEAVTYAGTITISSGSIIHPNVTTNVCRNYNNLFGLYNSSIHDYYRFRSWEESVAGYVRMIQRRYDSKKDKDYYAFLKRIGYAENMDSYNAKVRAIANTL